MVIATHLKVTLPAHRLTALLSLRLVLETLGPLPQDRKCFRMINGVLVERTVKDVIPILKTNSEGLKKVLDELLKQYKKQQDDMEKWKVRLSNSTWSRGFTPCTFLGPFLALATRHPRRHYNCG